MTKFDPTKPVQTRDGREAEICWTDGGGEFPIGGWYRGRDGNKGSANWRHNGETLPDGIARDFDLINIPEKPTTIERWFNIMKGGGTDGEIYETAEDAAQETLRTGRKDSIIARVSAVITFTPGEGLDE